MVKGMGSNPGYLFKIFSTLQNLLILFFLLHISVVMLISNLFFLVLPVPLTIAWLIAKSYEAETDLNYCGASSYINLKSYWILEGPRFAAFILNILILLSVIRVLVTHLSCNEILDTNQIK